MFPSPHSQRPPSGPERAPRASARRRIGRRVACALGVGWALVAACTLTSADYDPPLVGRDPLAVEDAGPPPTDEPCGAGVECCDVVPCASGGACVDGSCAVVAPEQDAGEAECVGSDCVVEPVPLTPSCDDGERNGDETGTDCGGNCPTACSVGAGCQSDADCGAGLFCSPDGNRCLEVACNDGVLNGEEVLTDCGGGACAGCPDGSPCTEATDCASAVCGAGGTCSAPSCNDEQRNQDETGVDCGGGCPQNCGTGQGCEGGNDCQSGVCGSLGCAEGDESCCQAPSCADAVINGGESDVDCGTLACGGCPVGDSCAFGFQCSTGLCQAGNCAVAPSCDDDVQNGNETDTDCGGGVCGRCADRSSCVQPADCVNNNCFAGVCISCGDNVQDGTETGVDCGGADPFCRRCNPGERCASNTDCVSQFCLGGFCS